MNKERFKPAAPRRVLLLLAGLLWIGAGALLLSFAGKWLSAADPAHRNTLLVAGALAGLLIHHFGFLRIVDRNLGRLLPIEGRRCVFSFISWKSYVIVATMMSAGVALRHSPIPKPYLAVAYLGIGLALVLSSVRYLRVLLVPPAA